MSVCSMSSSFHSTSTLSNLYPPFMLNLQLAPHISFLFLNMPSLCDVSSFFIDFLSAAFSASVDSAFSLVDALRDLAFSTACAARAVSAEDAVSALRRGALPFQSGLSVSLAETEGVTSPAFWSVRIAAGLIRVVLFVPLCQ